MPVGDHLRLGGVEAGLIDGGDDKRIGVGNERHFEIERPGFAGLEQTGVSDDADGSRGGGAEARGPEDVGGHSSRLCSRRVKVRSA